MIPQPTPTQISAAREAAGLTQQQAGELVHTDGRTWRRWEAGDRAINLAAWELFLIKSAKPADPAKNRPTRIAPVAQT